MMNAKLQTTMASALSLRTCQEFDLDKPQETITSTESLSSNNSLSFDPIDPQTISDLTDDQLDSLIAARQQRRMAPVRHYEEAQRAKQEYQDAQARDLLHKKLQQFEKQLGSVDTALEKLEKRALEIRALRLQLE